MKLTYGQYQIFDYIPGFVYLQASDYSIVYANKRFIELFGKPEGRHCYELMEKRDKPCEKCSTFNVFRTKEPRRERWESTSGRIYMIYKNYFVGDNGQGLVIKIGMDITEEESSRSRMDEEIEISLVKYRTLFESVPFGITISDDAGNIVESNHMAEHLLGLPKKDQLSRQIDGREWHIIRPDGSLMPPDEYASVRALKENRLVSNVVMGLVKEEEDIVWILVTATPIPLEGYGVAIVYSNITELKQTEDTLKKKKYDLNERVKELSALKTISDLILSSVPPDDMFRGVIDAIIPAMKYPESTSVRIVFDGKEFKSKGFAESEWKIGKKINIEGKEKGSLEVFYTKKMPDADIGPFCFEEENMIDIICRRLETHISMQESKDELKNTLNRLNNIINFLPDATFVVDRDEKVIAWNNAIERMTGIKREDILGRSDLRYESALYGEKLPVLIDFILHPDYMLPEKYEYVKEEEGYISAESYLPEAFDGKGAYMLGVASLLYDEYGNIEGAIESLRDISELKKKERDLVQSLEEKKGAIVEIHHRVKNNLQVISSLIQMQQYNIKDNVYAELFENLNNRIISIARVYENLIEREDFQKISIQNLVNGLISGTMLSRPHTIDIQFDVDVIDENLELDTAVSLSMIISELLGNVIKHAFVGREKGHVRVYLQKEGEKSYLLEISDDGVGYRGETDLSKAETLGMRLVGILVERDLHGTVDIDVNGGTTFTIRFVP